MDDNLFKKRRLFFSLFFLFCFGPKLLGRCWSNIADMSGRIGGLGLSWDLSAEGGEVGVD